MDLTQLAAIMLPAVFLLVFLGMPVAFALIAISTLFAWPIFGALTGLQLYQFIGSVSANYALAAIPLFIFMGAVLESSGIGRRAFEAMTIWFGRLPGGLAIATMAMSTLFAAGTGVVGAVEVMIGLLVVMPMTTAGYSRTMIAGTVCAGGSLGTMIPPSVVIVVYASVAQVPVGSMFSAVLIPAFIMVALFLGWQILYALIYPERAPRVTTGADLPLGRKLALTGHALLPPLVLVSSVIGSILLGIAAVTEAAAIGAVGAVLLNLVYREFDIRAIWRAAVKTVIVSTMIFFLVIGGTMFSSIFRLQGGVEMVSGLLGHLDLSTSGLVISLLLVLFIAGMFLDWISAVLICTPIFYPFLVAAGVDPIWFGVLAVIVLQSSYLTPPLAPAIFYLKSVTPPEFSTLSMYLGVVPFIACQILTGVVVYFLPELATYLPQLFKP